MLISYVARELNTTYKSASADPSLVVPTSEAIDSAIKQGFVRLDHDIVHESVKEVLKSKERRVAAELLAPALSGSCALLSFYDSQSKDLKVAVTGDSRAVLGRRGPSGKWTAKALSEDQTGGTPSEIQRLREEHPGEPYVTKNGRILGQLEPSRAFGDAFYKWSRDVQDVIKAKFFGRTPHPMLKTPPYVTAEPVITTTKVDPSKGDFIVMATDGLWEMLSNEEVVGLVGQWVEQQQSAMASGSTSKAWLQSWFGSQKELPVETAADGSAGGQRRPIRQQQYDIAGAASRFVVEDKNAATHLVRNAMGGKDKDMVCALLTLPSPYSRRYRYVFALSLIPKTLLTLVLVTTSPLRLSSSARVLTHALLRSTRRQVPLSNPSSLNYSHFRPFRNVAFLSSISRDGGSLIRHNLGCARRGFNEIFARARTIGSISLIYICFRGCCST